MPSRSHASVRQAWVERIDRFQQSGQSVAEFCSAENVSQASLYHWRKKIGSPATATAQSLPAFVPVKLRPSDVTPNTTIMSVELPGGVHVRFEVTQTARRQS